MTTCAPKGVRPQDFPLVGARGTKVFEAYEVVTGKRSLGDTKEKLPLSHYFSVLQLALDQAAPRHDPPRLSEGESTPTRRRRDEQSKRPERLVESQT